MAAKPDREIAVSLRCEAVPPHPDGLAPVVCLACRAPLDLHQPDPGRPDRILGTCDGCGQWHLIDCRPDDGSAVVALLPDSFF